MNDLATEPGPEAGKKVKKEFIYYYDTTDFSVNDHWYYLAILDLTTCSNFQSDPQWIAQRLGISSDEVRAAIEQLQKEKLLVVKDGKYIKVINDLIIPTLGSREKIRQYHKTMSVKAVQVMEQKTSMDDFNKRLIMGSTIAVNPARLEKAKEIINTALEEIIETLTEGECTELYHFNLQLFSLLNQAEEK